MNFGKTQLYSQRILEKPCNVKWHSIREKSLPSTDPDRSCLIDNTLNWGYPLSRSKPGMATVQSASVNSTMVIQPIRVIWPFPLNALHVPLYVKSKPKFNPPAESWTENLRVILAELSGVFIVEPTNCTFCTIIVFLVSCTLLLQACEVQIVRLFHCTFLCLSRWYLEKFGQKYPRSRKAVIPFIL